jgi:hypothetical protein
MLSPKPSDPAHDIRLRMLLSSWKLSRGFRAVGARYYRKRLVPNASQTDLNREFGSRRQTTAGWFLLTLLVLAAIDYLYLRVGPAGVLSWG